MSTIKSTISLLCKQFKLLSNVDINPETIRRAKFNQSSDNVEALLLVLYRLCRELIWKGNDANITESSEEKVIFVKLCLAAWGYQRTAFYQVSANGVGCSQELLIALAWMLAKQNVFEKLLLRKISLFQEELNGHEKHQAIKAYSEDSSSNGKFEDVLNKTMLLCGKLKHNLSNTIRLRQKNFKLLNKIHYGTRRLTESHLTLCEARMFFKDCDKLITSARELCMMIKMHKIWEQQSYMFWKWMDTVLVQASLNSNALDYIHKNNNMREFLRVLIVRLGEKLIYGKESEVTKINIASGLISTIQGGGESLKLKIIKELLTKELKKTKLTAKKVEVALKKQIQCTVLDAKNTKNFI